MARDKQRSGRGPVEVETQAKHGASPHDPREPPARAAAYIPPTAAPKETRYHTIDMKAVRLSPDIDPQRMKTQLSLRAVRAAASERRPASRAPWLVLLLVGGALGTCAWWFSRWRLQASDAATLVVAEPVHSLAAASGARASESSSSGLASSGAALPAPFPSARAAPILTPQASTSTDVVAPSDHRLPESVSVVATPAPAPAPVVRPGRASPRAKVAPPKGERSVPTPEGQPQESPAQPRLWLE